MRLAIATLFLSVLGFLVDVPGAAAKPGHGAIGAQSQADVRISVSVLPRFKAEPAYKSKDASSNAEGTALLAINAPNLRYSVIRLGPNDERFRNSSRTSPGNLLLVVPD